MNVAIIGYGAIATAHGRVIELLRTTPEWQNLRLTAVMGRLPEPTAAFARQFGCDTATTDLTAMLADPAVAAVIICSPSNQHASQAALALQAGKHVLCEIPLATSLADTDRLIRIADEAQRRLMACHTLRFQGPLAEVRRLIVAGALHPHAVVARYLFLARENVGRTGRPRSWTDNLLWHHGCHAVDTVLWLLGGEEADVVAQVAPPGELGIPMDIALALRSKHGRVGSVALSYNCHLPVSDYVVIGQERSLLIGGDQFRTQEHVLADGTSHPIARQDAEFFSAIREGREPSVSARAVRPTMAVLQAAQESVGARIAVRGAEAGGP